MNTLLQVGIVLTAMDKMSGVLTGAADKAAAGFARLQQRVHQVGQALTEMGTKASLMGHGILAGLETPIKAFADLDEASTNLRVAMMDNFGQIPPQFAEINRQAIELGNVLPGTTADFVNSARALIENGTALETIVGGGLKAASYLGVILKIPQAGAAEMVAKFREAFGLTENELVKMADLTQRAQFAFGLNPEEIKYAAQYAGSTLNNLKLTGLENTKMFLAMQGIARQKGMEGSVFGTNFSSMLNNIGMMESKLHRNSKIMREVNADLRHAGIRLQFFDKAGHFVGLEKMVGQLEKLKVLSEKDRLNVINRLFGMEGGRVASMLADAGKDGLQHALGTMQKQADLMQRIDEVTKSAKNTWEALTGTVTNFWAAVGGPMVTALYPLINKVNEFVGGPMMAWVDRNKDLVKWLGLAALASGVLLVALGGLGIVAGAVASGLAVVSGALAAVFSPVTLVVAAIAGAALLIYKYWHPLKAFFIGFWKGFKEGLAPIQPILNRLQGAFDAAAEKAKAFWNWLSPSKYSAKHIYGIQKFGQGFGKAFGDALAKFMGFVNGVKQGVTVGLAALTPLKPMVTQVVGWFAPLLSLGRLLYTVFLKAWVDGAIQLIGWFGRLIAPITQSATAAQAFGYRVGRGIAEVIKFVANLAQAFFDLPGTVYDAGVGMITQLMAGIKSKAAALYDVVKDVAAKVRSYWPFSPAKEGPLRDLHRVRIIETIAEAVHPAPLVQAMSAAAAAGMLALTPLANVPSMAMPAPQPALRPVAPLAAHQDGRGAMPAAPISINYTVNVQGGGGLSDKNSIMAALKANEHELVRLIQDVLARNARKQY